MTESLGGRRLPSARVAVLVVGALVAGLLGVAQPVSATTTPVPLTGLFRLTAGSWTGTASTGHVGGTYFRMIQPGSSASSPTYLANANSRAANQTYTILNPGTAGGLRTGVYQPDASPAFASNGDALSSSVIAPETFFGVKFSAATNKVDPQTKLTTALPSISATGTALSGDLRAFSASWNDQYFNQGAPKPDATLPGLTQALSGTYDPNTRAFAFTWRSLIVGGPFNGFTGEWHFDGTFIPNVLISTSTLPNGVIGKSYSGRLAATGGRTGYAWTLFSGALPAGLKLASTGVISGVPSAPGTATFTVKVADSTVPKNVDTKTLSIVVPPVVVNSLTLPTGLIGKTYPATRFTSTGGKATLVWTVISGSLPPGLKLATTGALSGVPTTAGTSTFTVQVADASVPKNLASRQFSLTVAPFAVATTSVPSGTVGVTYPTTKLTATGGKGTLVWKVVGGALPPGVLLSTAGSLSGRPTAAGSYSFTVQVSDASSPKNVATKAFVIAVAS